MKILFLGSFIPVKYEIYVPLLSAAGNKFQNNCINALKIDNKVIGLSFLSLPVNCEKENLTISLTLTLPDESVETLNATSFTPEVEGEYKVSLTTSDEALNTITSEEITFKVVDLYKSWSNNEREYYATIFGESLPSSDLFNDNYDVYQIQDFNGQPASGVRFEFSSYEESLLEGYYENLKIAGYTENTYEEIYCKDFPASEYFQD